MFKYPRLFVPGPCSFNFALVFVCLIGATFATDDELRGGGGFGGNVVIFKWSIVGFFLIKSKIMLWFETRIFVVGGDQSANTQRVIRNFMLFSISP